MTEVDSPQEPAQPARVARPDSGRLLRYGVRGLLVIAFAAMLVSVQAVLFYQMYAPRVAEANRLLFDLMVENSQRDLYRRIAGGIEELRISAETEVQASNLREAWNTFGHAFDTAPDVAIEELRSVLARLSTTASSAEESVAGLHADLQRLQDLHTDPYKPLLEDLDDPPLYLWPSASFLATRSGYRDAVTLNYTVHLAQVGEIGTARVMLTGLRASAEDPRMLGLIYYMLGRLQFELFLSRPEAEFYTQSVQYLRQSLQVDPDSQLARRFIDYLLSLSQGDAAPKTGEGPPTTVSDGEGAAISADKRRF